MISVNQDVGLGMKKHVRRGAADSVRSRTPFRSPCTIA